MATLLRGSVYLHVLAALVWLGGMLTFALAAPVLRDVRDDGLRQALFHRLGLRFRVVGWVCLVLLLVTGLVQLRLRGWWGTAFWTAPGLWTTPLGVSLAGKLITATAMVAIQALHDFWLGPRAGAVPAGTPEAAALRRRAALLARLNALLGLVLIWFAVALPRGG